MKDAKEWLQRIFSDEDFTQLHSIKVQVSTRRELNMEQLLTSWFFHVQKLKGDLDLPDDDRTIWGLHDLIASAVIRQLVQNKLEDVDQRIGLKIKKLLHQIDSEFKLFTEVDVNLVVEKADG